jgi:hypothetical protein
MVLAFTGTLLCFSFNVAYTAISMSLNVAKSDEHHVEIQTRLLQESGRFKTLSDKRAVSTGLEYQRLTCELQQSYLILLELNGQVHDTEKTIRHQRLQLMTAVIRDILIPPLFIASLVFMPLTIGIPILIASVAIAVAMYFSLANKAPEKTPTAGFSDKAFNAFCLRTQNGTPESILKYLEPVSQSGVLKKGPFFSAKTATDAPDSGMTPSLPPR